MKMIKKGRIGIKLKKKTKQIEEKEQSKYI